MKVFNIETARALLDLEIRDDNCVIQALHLRASLRQAVEFLSQFQQTSVPGASFEVLDAHRMVQYRRIDDGLVEVRMDPRLLWNDETLDELGVVRFRLTIGDLHAMMTELGYGAIQGPWNEITQ